MVATADLSQLAQDRPVRTTPKQKQFSRHPLKDEKGRCQVMDSFRHNLRPKQST